MHAANVDADTFPRAILESLACGTPAVATAVCGIPEQIKGLRLQTSETLDVTCYDASESTGILVPHGDAEVMADGIRRLLTDDALRLRLGENAAKDAAMRFDLRRQVNDYLQWYRQVLGNAPHLSGTMSIGTACNGSLMTENRRVSQNAYRT